MINARLRSVKCEDFRSKSRAVDVPTQRRDGMSLNQRVMGDHAAQGYSTTLSSPLVLVQTPQPRPLAQNGYFRMVDRRKITVSS